MLIIEDNTISLTRGDTAYIGINLTDNSGNPYEALEGDTVTLSVKRSINDKTCALQITVPFGEDIYIRPEDTKDLKYGRYVYDIQVNTARGEVYTVVAKSAFKLTAEVNV